MSHDDLDHILSREEDIVPSSGFVSNVMTALRNEVSAPPPIPFPWRRALPGLAACLAALVVLAAVALANSSTFAPVPVPVPALVQAAATAKALWIALALVLTLASVTISLRLAGYKT
jgi:hypothetical protein